MTSLPERFVGAWERHEFVLDGVVAAGAGRAVWLEAGAAYVDVRGPGDTASDTCFAGTTTWEAPKLTWVHEIDRQDGGAEPADSGTITLDGDDLIEEGDHIGDLHAAYRERWRRLPGWANLVCAAASDTGIAVRVGAHAAVVVDGRLAGGGFAANYRFYDGAEWTTELAVGDGTEPLPPPLDPAEPLPFGWRWRR